MLKIAYQLGCLEALVKLGALDMSIWGPKWESQGLTQAEGLAGLKRYQQAETAGAHSIRPSGTAFSRGGFTPEMQRSQRALHHFTGSTLEAGPSPADVRQRSILRRQATPKNPVIPPLPQWANPESGAHGYGNQPTRMATEPTRLGVDPRTVRNAPLTGREGTQRLSALGLEELRRSEHAGTQVIPRESMRELMLPKTPTPKTPTPKPSLLRRMAQKLSPLRRLAHV